MKKTVFKEIPAFKFKFIVTLEYLEVRMKRDWRPKDLQLIWRRGQRQREFDVGRDAMSYTSKVIDDVDCDIASASWDRPASCTLLVTLYKAADHSPTFRKKEYIFSLVDNRGLNKRKLAVFPLDIAEYASVERRSDPLEMEFRTLSNKTTMVTAGIHIECQYVKKGLSTDDDMISNFSHVSDDEEEHRRMTLSMDDEICKTVISCPVQQQAKSNAEVLQNRAKQTKSQLFLDLNIAETLDLSSIKVPASPSPELKNFKDDSILSLTSDKKSPRNDINSEVNLRVSEPNRSHDRETKERRRLSALKDHQVSPKEENDSRKSPKGSIFTTLRYGVKAVFQGRKGSVCNDQDSSDGGIDGVKAASPSGSQDTSTTTEGSPRMDTGDSNRMMRRIHELETMNQALYSQYEELEQENATLRGDVEDLQTEVGELQLLVEDLQSRLVQAEVNKPTSSLETDRLFEKMNLRGWLCKRGVKGGPIGKRWQRRWFAMDAKGYLYYYKSNNNTVPRGFIALDLILAVEDVFQTVQDKNNASFNVITDGRTYELMAHDQEEKEKWINALDFIRSWRAQMANISL